MEKHLHSTPHIHIDLIKVRREEREAKKAWSREWSGSDTWKDVVMRRNKILLENIFFFFSP